MLIQNQHVAHGKNHHAIMLESHPLPVPFFFVQPFGNEQADLPLGKSVSMTDSASESP
jgi:hypothetical protein